MGMRQPGHYQQHQKEMKQQKRGMTNKNGTEP